MLLGNVWQECKTMITKDKLDHPRTPKMNKPRPKFPQCFLYVRLIGHFRRIAAEVLCEVGVRILAS